MEMRRYLVKCMFQVCYYQMGGGRLPKTGWVERLFYLRAPDIDSSYKQTEELCLEYECEYEDRNGEYVTCRLYEITDSFELNYERLQNGTELYHNFFDANTEEVEWMLRKQYGEKDPDKGSEN